MEMTIPATDGTRKLTMPIVTAASEHGKKSISEKRPDKFHGLGWQKKGVSHKGMK
jgi:hypothetical protein